LVFFTDPGVILEIDGGNAFGVVYFQGTAEAVETLFADGDIYWQLELP
jgi:hypothetical protein